MKKRHEGLTEAIAEKERQYYPQKELTEDRIEELNQKLSRIQLGDIVTLRYYCQYARSYNKLTGMITKMDTFWKALQLDGKTIEFCEIDDISW